MSEQEQEQPKFPNYSPVHNHGFMERSQAKPLFKFAKMMLKMPKQKVLQRRNRVTKKKFKII